jgi:small nuclear ribonucleoprotein (snRNP)-like protein
MSAADATTTQDAAAAAATQGQITEMMKRVSEIGFPLAMLHAARGLPLALELSNGDRWRGICSAVDDAGNIELTDATHHEGTAPKRSVPSAFIKGGNVMFAVLPPEAKAAFPYLPSDRDQLKKKRARQAEAGKEGGAAAGKRVSTKTEADIAAAREAKAARRAARKGEKQE